MPKIEFKTDLKKIIKELEEGIDDLGVTNSKIDEQIRKLKAMGKRE